MKCINFYIVLLLVFSLIIINQSNESKDLYFFGNDYEPVIPRKLMYTEPTALDLTLFKNTIPGFSTSDIRSISMSNNKYLATIITNGKLFISGFHSRYTFFNETCKDSKERPYYIESLAPYEPIKQASVSTDWVSFVDKNDNIWMYSSYDKNALQRVTGQYDPVTHGSITDIKNYGYNNFVAKTSTGFVIGWKFDDPIQTTVIVIPLDVKKIVCGADHCLALTHIKTVYSWGDNGVGQLGVPSSVLGTTSTPIAIFENDTVIDIAAGTYFSMVLTSNYSLYGFGSNLDNHFYIDSQYTYVENEINYLNPMIGFLNNTINVTRIYTSGFNKAAFDASSNIHLWTLSYLQYNRAVRKENAVGVITAFNSTNSQEGDILLFELGDEVFLATTSSNIYGWGRNSYLIGTGEINYRCALYPVGNRLQINTQNLTRISSGGVVFLVQEGDKQLKAWGQNLEIIVGNPAVYYNYSVFEPVSVLDNLTSTVSSLGISRTSFVGLKDGSVYYWGINNYNQAGNASFQLLEPTQTFTNRFEFVMASTSHSCGKDLRGGQIFCWGRFDALGDGVTYPYWIAGVADPSPVAFDTPMPNIIKLSVGHGFTIALSNTSEVYTWGRNQHYNIGDGTKVTRTTPYWLTSLSGKNIIQVYALYTISFALSGEGKVYYWGRLTYEGREILFSTTPTLLNNIPNNRRIKKISGYDNLIILVSTRDEIFYISPLFPQFRQLEPQTRNMKVLDVSASGNTALVYAETDVCPSGYYPYPTCDSYDFNQKRGGAVVNVLKQTAFASTLLLNLLPYGNGDYTFNVTVSDIKANLQGDTVSSKAISIVSPFNITMSVNGLPSLVANNVLRTSENVLSASVSSTCGNLNTNLFSFNWLLTGSDSSNLPAGTSNTLVIPTKTFQSIKSIYMAEVTVSFQTVTNSKTISLYTFPQNAFLQLLGGNRSISITESATLTSTLVDLDDLAVTPTYSWSCVLSSGLPCPASLNNVATSSLTIPANTFLDADVAYFTLTTTIGSVKSVSSVVFLQLEKLKLPTLIVNKYDLYVSKFKDILFRVNVIPSDSESTLTFDWTLIEGSPLIDLQKISIAGTDKQDFGIAASTGNFNNLLVEGNEYTLQLNVTQTNGRLKQTVSAFSRITFKVNQSPNAGNLLISPSNGTATLTEFTLSADSFVDPDQPNTPLSYAFGYYKVNDNKLKEKIILVDYSGNILGKTKLPLENNNNNDETIEVFVVARDSYGGETLVSKVINLVDPTKALSTDQITKLVQQQLNITTGVNDVLLASSLLNTNTPTPTDNTFCGQDNKCSGNGNCDLVLKKCNCNALFTGTYCQLTVVEKVQRETVRDQLLDNVIKSSTENGNLTTTSTKTILQTVESIITKTDEVNTNTVKKALTYTSTVFTTSKQQVDLTDQVLKVVSNVISTVVSNPTVNTTDINDAIRQTLKDVATQQVTNMIQGQVKTVTLPQITQTIVKDTVTTIITNTPKDQKYKLPTKLKEVLNPNNIISLETTFIGNQNIFTNEKNVSSNVFRMNIFSNDQQLLISNLTDTILFNLTVSNGIILENENLTFICQYFNESTKQLSSEGVEAKRIITLGNETIVECSTSHLTDFVIAKTTSLNKKIIPVQSSNPPRNISPKKTPLISYSSNVNYYISLLWFMVVYGIYILM
ncbi:hypothetical protein ABK040_013952 [Willaertia magna]